MRRSCRSYFNFSTHERGLIPQICGVVVNKVSFSSDSLSVTQQAPCTRQQAAPCPEELIWAFPPHCRAAQQRKMASAAATCQHRTTFWPAAAWHNRLHNLRCHLLGATAVHQAAGTTATRNCTTTSPAAAVEVGSGAATTVYYSHRGVTVARALHVANVVIERCRNLAVLTTSQAVGGCSDSGGDSNVGQPQPALTSRLLGVHFPELGADGKPDLRRVQISTNPRTRKAAELRAASSSSFMVERDGARPAGHCCCSLCFAEPRSEAYLALYCSAAELCTPEARARAWRQRYGGECTACITADYRCSAHITQLTRAEH
jgi:hypothetical protein